MIPTGKKHTDRIEKELQAAGVTGYGSMKFASKYLPTVIHEAEHIRAAVYGRYRQDDELMGLSAGMLIATDYRVIFLDHKPGYTTMDELAYDIVSGIKTTSAGLFSTVTLHTRAGDYTLRYVGAKGIGKFVQYIENRRLETADDKTTHFGTKDKVVESKSSVLQGQTLDFLKERSTAVLSTVNRTGAVHGAAVHYLIGSDKDIYILTKASTQKARDVFANQQVALTVYDVALMQTVQLQGIAAVENDPSVRGKVINTLGQPHAYGGELHQPPVATIHQEGFVVIKIDPTESKFSDFKKAA